ncbi:DNA polymerase [Geopseudomonas aromaticivorans]
MTTPELVLIDATACLRQLIASSCSNRLNLDGGRSLMLAVSNLLDRVHRRHPEATGLLVTESPKTGRVGRLYAHSDPAQFRFETPLITCATGFGMHHLVAGADGALQMIASLAHQAEQMGRRATIVSDEPTLRQCVSRSVSVFDPAMGTEWTPERVARRYGVEAHVLPHVLANAASDDAVVGHQGDADALTALLTLEVSPAHAAKLESLPYTAPRWFDLYQFFLEHQQRKRADRVYRANPEIAAKLARESKERIKTRKLQQAKKKELPPSIEFDVEVVLDTPALQALIARLREAGRFVVETFAEDTNPHHTPLIGLGFALGPAAAFYVPVGHHTLPVDGQLAREETLQMLAPLLESPALTKIARRAKHDLCLLGRYGVKGAGFTEDVPMLSYALDASASRHRIHDLAPYYLGVHVTPYDIVVGKGKNKIPFSQVDADSAAQYAGELACLCWRLLEHLAPQLEAKGPQAAIYRDIEMPLIPVLARMESHGANLDAHQLHECSGELLELMDYHEGQVHKLAAVEVNLNSPQQLADVLYKDLKLPVLGFTPAGQPSTSEEVMEGLAAQGHGIARHILLYRAAYKLRSTYAIPLPAQINRETERLHTSYHQAVANTGRLVSADPNLQNIPIRSNMGKRIRRAFVAPEGYKLVAADYSQIELRIMAHISGDAGFIEAFNLGLDIHRATAAEMFAVPLAEVTNEQRRSAKAINFGLIYGMSAFGLAAKLGCSQDAARAYMRRFFRRYPGVKHYMDRISEQGPRDGHVVSLFGRRLPLPRVQPGKASSKRAAGRAAINAPMQGTAADIIKRAMIHIDAWLQDSGIDARMILQVHDELVFEVAEDQVTTLVDGIRPIMCGAAELLVPLEVEIGVGNNWEQAH